MVFGIGEAAPHQRPFDGLWGVCCSGVEDHFLFYQYYY